MGCDIEVGDFVGRASQYVVSFKTNEHLKIIGHFYRAKLIGNNYMKTEDDHELIWILPKEAINKMHVEYQVWAIKKLLEEL